MRAINATIMRQINRKLILNHIRTRPISRAELADATCLTRASITQIIDELITEGIVMETAMVGRTRLGRKSTQLAIDPDAGILFGVNLSRTQCNVGAINMRGEVLWNSAEMVSGRAPEDVLDAIAATMRREMEALSEGVEVLGVGFCAPGRVNAERGLLEDPVHFEAWRKLPVARMLSRRIGIPVCLMSAANARALDEKYFGGMEDRFALVCVDEDVYASVVAGIDPSAEVIDLGRFIVKPEDESGSLEQFVSIPALLSGTGCRGWAELMDGEGAQKGVVVDRMVKYLSAGLANLYWAFRVARFVLTGDLAYRAEEWLDNLKAAVADRIGQEIDISVDAEVNPVRMGAVAAYDKFFRPEFEA